jgi:ribonuclease HI
LLTNVKAQQTGYAAEMTDFDLLPLAASQSEPGASRVLADRTRRASDAARASARAAKRAAALARRKLRHDGPPTPWRAWFDGSAHPNPGNCGIGALLTGPAGERIEISRAAGYGNSSEAEYRALIALLEAAVQAGADGLTIYGDSKVVIDDLNGSDAAAAPSLSELRRTALALTARLTGHTLRWIPRHKNGEADALSQLARRQTTSTDIKE